MKMLGLLGLVAGIGGCFTPPSGIRAAEDALRAAESEGAEEYLPVEHATTKDLLELGKRELGRQESESITHRSYRRANRLFAAAEEGAVKLRERTVKRKEEVRLLIVPEMQMLMVSADLLGELGSDEVEVVTGAIDSAARAYREGRHIDALITIRDAQSAADEILEGGRQGFEPGA